MIFALVSDEDGHDHLEAAKVYLDELGVEWKDYTWPDYDPIGGVVDACKAVAEGATLAIGLSLRGQSMAMMANKIGAVASVVFNQGTAAEAVTHDEATFISLVCRHIPVNYCVDQHIRNVLRDIVREVAKKEVVGSWINSTM